MQLRPPHLEVEQMIRSCANLGGKDLNTLPREEWLSRLSSVYATYVNRHSAEAARLSAADFAEMNKSIGLPERSKTYERSFSIAMLQASCVLFHQHLSEKGLEVARERDDAISFAYFSELERLLAARLDGFEYQIENQRASAQFIPGKSE